MSDIENKAENLNSEATDEMLASSTNIFGNTLTMAETAYIESLTGENLADSDETASVQGMIIVAAQRLGVELTTDETKQFSYDQVSHLFLSAAKVPAKVDSENVNKVLALIAGK